MGVVRRNHSRPVGLATGQQILHCLLYQSTACKPAASSPVQPFQHPLVDLLPAAQPICDQRMISKPVSTFIQHIQKQAPRHQAIEDRLAGAYVGAPALLIRQHRCTQRRTKPIQPGSFQQKFLDIGGLADNQFVQPLYLQTSVAGLGQQRNHLLRGDSLQGEGKQLDTGNPPFGSLVDCPDRGRSDWGIRPGRHQLCSFRLITAQICGLEFGQFSARPPTRQRQGRFRARRHHQPHSRWQVLDPCRHKVVDRTIADMVVAV